MLKLVPPLTYEPDLRAELGRDLFYFQLIASAPARREEITTIATRRAQEIEQLLEKSDAS